MILASVDALVGASTQATAILKHAGMSPLHPSQKCAIMGTVKSSWPRFSLSDSPGYLLGRFWFGVSCILEMVVVPGAGSPNLRITTHVYNSDEEVSRVEKAMEGNKI